jgi:hypothetical protein
MTDKGLLGFAAPGGRGAGGDSAPRTPSKPFGELNRGPRAGLYWVLLWEVALNAGSGAEPVKVAGGQSGAALIVNGPADHVHLLLSMPAAISVADLLRVLKTNSCRWVHEQFPARKRFGWQAGYGVFTVSGSRLEEVRNYIATQQTHHHKVSFQEEFLALLRRHGLMCVADEVRG